MRSHKFRIAALEQPGALSGLPDSTHRNLIEEELKAPEIDLVVQRRFLSSLKDEILEMLEDFPEQAED